MRYSVFALITFLNLPHLALGACPTFFTEAIFNAVAPSASAPYTYAGLCAAIDTWNVDPANAANQIFVEGTEMQQKHEIASFLGNTLHESGDFQFAREALQCGDNVVKSDGTVLCKPCDSANYVWGANTCSVSKVSGGSYTDPYCDTRGLTPTTDPPGCTCSPATEDLNPAYAGYVPANSLFFGRGAIQLSWNYNYIHASLALTGDENLLCNSPDMVATDESLAWGVAIYFWMTHVKNSQTSHQEVLVDASFGATVDNINGGLECPAGGVTPGSYTEGALKARLNKYCHAATTLGVDALLSLSECNGLDTLFTSCTGDSSCTSCNAWVGVTSAPTNAPTNAPTGTPAPTSKPTLVPTSKPTEAPTGKPTVPPTLSPTKKPTLAPTIGPTANPTTAPPTVVPTQKPTSAPTTAAPTNEPTTSPPTVAPTQKPTPVPTTAAPTNKPTTAPPTTAPTSKPSAAPTTAAPTASPTLKPTGVPTLKPTTGPTTGPTSKPTYDPAGLVGYYPDWLVDNVCKNDGNPPDYMAANPAAWLMTSLDACCAAHFSWNLNACLGITVTSLGKFYPNWDQQVPGNICLFDEDIQAPGYIMSNPSLYMLDTLDGCCTKFYNYDYNSCMGIVATPPPPTNKWYVNYDTSLCVKDCPMGGEFCGGPVPTSMTLSDTIEGCCSKISWVPSNVCVAESQGLVPEGSNQWYVGNDGISCSKDCIGEPPCEGLATWQSLFIDATACCATKLYWMDQAECIANSVGP